MADIPAAPLEGTSSTSTDTKALLFLAEDDGAAGLRAALLGSAGSAVVNAQRLGALAVGGRVAHDAASADNPVPVAGVYTAAPAAVGDGDVVDLLMDPDGRPIIVGAAAEDAAADGNPVQVAGRYDSTDRGLDNGDVGALALDSRARAIVAPIVADATTALAAKTVGAVTTEVLAAEANRVAATFINDSDEVIYLAIGVNAVMNQGIRLNSQGGSFEINFLNMDKREVDAICSSGGKNLCVLEIHRT